jgi:predicted MFS family arabinose efflux permease
VSAGDPRPAQQAIPAYSWYVLGVLFAVNAFNFVDRQILAILQEGIKEDLALSDTQLGFLSIGFSAFYIVAGFPIAYLADRGVRRTIISLGIAAWSVMTIGCGMAQSFFQLAAARFGVGVGEASAGPAGGSLLSDYFPPARRATAFAIQAIAIHVGIFIGFALGGWVAQQHGWRMAFWVAGAPGLLLAVLLRATVREPARGAMDGIPSAAQAPPLREVLRTLWQLRTLRHLAIANTASVMAGASVFAWGPSFLIRHHGLDRAEVGLWMGILTGVCGAVGTLAAGIVTDRLVRGDVRSYFWVPLAGALLAIPPAIGFATWPDGEQAIWLIGPFVIVTGMYLGPVSALTQTLLPQRTRALGVAVLQTFTTLIGIGLGPQLVGIASDALEPRHGTKSVGVALLYLSVVAYLWSAGHYLVGARYIRGDLRRVAG